MPQQLAPKPYRSLPVSQRYDGLGRGFAIVRLLQPEVLPSKFCPAYWRPFSFPFSAMRVGRSPESRDSRNAGSRQTA